jgi:3-hydroxybutyrate dehydrogenase
MPTLVDEEWSDRTAIVTGAASGIGLALSARLAALGAKVVMVDLPGRMLERASESIPGAIPKDADLSDPAAIHRLTDAVDQADILVNSASLSIMLPIIELTDEKWGELLTVMLTAPFMLTRAALPGMIRRDFGRIINVASVYGLVGSTRRAAYVSAKHGLLGLTKAAAIEAAAGSPEVTVNAVSPSYVRTNEIERLVAEQALATGVGEEDMVRQFLHRNLIKRLIDPVEVAETIVFLCRADMWSITGQTINMDAGWLAT